MKYIPTHCEALEIVIKVSNYLLGETVYILKVSAIDSDGEKFIEVQAPIGMTKSFYLPVKNPYQKLVAFIFKVSDFDYFFKKFSCLITSS